MSKPSTPIDWAKAACDSLMATYTPPMLPPENRWHYHQGVFLHGMMRLWEHIHEEKYYDYAKHYVDHLVDEYGNFYFRRDELDAIQAGLLLFPIFQRTGDKKYQIAAEKLRNLFFTLNLTSEGGYWHKDRYPYQMWLDGLYMGGVFAVQYANMFDEPAWFEKTLYQEKLMRKYMKDPATGLLYHAWDESKNMPWADPKTGCSPEFWGRSLGWYGIAAVDILQQLPQDIEGRTELIESLQHFVEGLVRFQDEKSGLWYQVVDKGDQPDNWLETSCAALFVYTIAKGINDGYIDKKYAEVAKKGYTGLVETMVFDQDNLLIMPDICIGTSAGDYENYVTRPTIENDLHGVGAFVLACIEIDKLES